MAIFGKMKLCELLLLTLSLLLLCRTTTAVQSEQDDGTVLCDIYSQQSDAVKEALTGWDSCDGSGPYSPCDSSDSEVGYSTWTGVGCETAGGVIRVVHLVVTDQGLSGTLPSTVGSMASLVELKLYYNSLSGTLPSQLGLLTNLQVLDLQNNQFTGSVTTTVGSMGSLKWLNLGGNSLSGSLPSQLGLLTNLEALDLYYNIFTSNIPTAVGSMGSLQSLSLYMNLLVGTLPSQLGLLTNLQGLDLGSNQFSGSVPTTVGSMGSLRGLNLGGNSLSGSLPSELGLLTNLEALALYNNIFTSNIPTTVGSMSSLTVLHLGGNSLSGSLPSLLGLLTNLQEVYLNDNEFTGSLPSQLSTLTNLQVLGLYNNQFTGSVPSTEGSIGSLTYLNLGMNLLVGTLPSQLGLLTNLQVLDLGSNQFTGSVPTTVGSMGSLTMLNLGMNSLSDSLPYQLGLLTNLQGLSLYSNNFAFSVPASFCSFSTSIDLQLQDNPGLTCFPSCLTNPPYDNLNKDSAMAVCSSSPTGQPSSQPSSQPTSQPSVQPSLQPTEQPWGQPSSRPTRQPTGQPTRQPTRQPTMQPSSQPSFSPTNPTGQPSRQPTAQPTAQPTRQPTGQPSQQPSCIPTGWPTFTPTEVAPPHIVRLTLAISGLSTSDLSELVRFAMRSALGTALGLPGRYVTPPKVIAQSRRLRGREEHLRLLADSTLYVDMSANFPASKWKTYIAPTSTSIIVTFENSFLAIAKMKINVLSFDAPGLGFVLPSSNTTNTAGESSLASLVTGLIAAGVLIAIVGYLYREPIKAVINSMGTSRVSPPVQELPDLITTDNIENQAIPWEDIIPPVVVSVEDEQMHGSYGTVFRGKLKGEVVAVKVFNLNLRHNLLPPTKESFKGALESLTNEANNLIVAQRSLDQRGIENRNIIKFCGYAFGPPSQEWQNTASIAGIESVFEGKMMALITKFEQGGNLHDALHTTTKRIALKTKEKIRLLRDIATGLSHLHNCPVDDGSGSGLKVYSIVHGDLKPQNILLSNSSIFAEVRIADFGLAKKRELVGAISTTSTGNGGGGTWPYDAPELSIRNGLNKLATKSRSTDMYAFGTLAWEVLTGKPPWEGLDDKAREEAILRGQVLSIDDPDMPIDTPKAVKDLIKCCLKWTKEWNRIIRPSIDQVLRALEDEYKSLLEESFDVFLSYNWGPQVVKGKVWKRQELVKQVYKSLTAEGKRVWFDEANMGSDLHKCMMDGVGASSCFVVFLSPEYCLSSNCLKELGFAHRWRKPIIVCMTENSDWKDWREYCTYDPPKVDGVLPWTHKIDFDQASRKVLDPKGTGSNGDIVRKLQLVTKMYCNFNKAYEVDWTSGPTDEDLTKLHGESAMLMLKQLLSEAEEQQRQRPWTLLGRLSPMRKNRKDRPIVHADEGLFTLSSRLKGRRSAETVVVAGANANPSTISTAETVAATSGGGPAGSGEPPIKLSLSSTC